MRADTQEFIADVPSQEYGDRFASPLPQLGVTALLEFGIPVGRVDEDVGVDYQHSIIFHRGEDRLPIRNFLSQDLSS